MLVRDAMTRDPASCTPDTLLVEVARLMVAHDCGALPVIRDDRERKPVGVVTDRDLVVRALAEEHDLRAITVTQVMSNSCVTILADAPIEECCRVMEAYQVRRILVVDERGGLIGIVAQADLASAASDEDLATTVKEISQPSFATTGALAPMPPIQG
ncbi:MAG: CBS domain-containing protein [Planctomycetes bacterium]|nr:CBS domain-containing protein [Planctomycetota bacterium]